MRELRRDNGKQAFSGGEQSRVAPLLQLSQVSKRFGTLVAVQDVSLQVEAGEVIGLVGRRGAGGRGA